MFKRKKFMALCATTLAGVSAMSSLAPMAAFADVAKTGDTIVTYIGTLKPAEWGLSVPANISLDETKNVGFMDGGGTGASGKGKLSIVSETGENFTDSSFDHTFVVSGNIDHTKEQYGRTQMTLSNNQSLYVRISDQGQDEVSDTSAYKIDEAQAKNLKNIEINTKSDGTSTAPFRTVRFAAAGSDSEIGANATISWTAALK